MLNLLNEISSLTLGLISIFVILAIIAIIIIINCKLKERIVITNTIAIVLSLIVAIFLCKPMLALFDKMFGFSLLFFNAFMLKYAQIDSLNVRVDAMNYSSVVNSFKTGDIGMSSTYKNFLINIFENTNPPSDNPTTLSAIASSSMSYIVSLFIVALILFIVSFVLFKLLIKLLSKKIKLKKQRNLKPLSIILGVFKGLLATFVVLITISTLPIINVTNDYFANGFQTTRVLSPLYNAVVTAEQDMYISSINFKNVNKKIYQSKENITYGEYQNDISGCELRVNVQIDNESIKINITNLDTSEVIDLDCDYIYANNSVYVFKENTFKYYFQYNEKNKCFKFRAESYGKMINYILELI